MLCQCDCRNLPEIAVTAIIQNVSVSFYLVLLPVSMHLQVKWAHCTGCSLLLGLLCLQFLIAKWCDQNRWCGSFTPLERNCRKVNCFPWLQYVDGHKIKSGQLESYLNCLLSRQCTQFFPCAVGVLSQWHELSQCHCSLACYLSSPGEMDVMFSVSRSQLPL